MSKIDWGLRGNETEYHYGKNIIWIDNATPARRMFTTTSDWSCSELYPWCYAELAEDLLEEQEGNEYYIANNIIILLSTTETYSLNSILKKIVCMLRRPIEHFMLWNVIEGIDK